MPSIFRTPETVLTGWGCFDDVGAHAARLGAHCLIVTGARAMREQGVLDKATGLMSRAGLRVSLYEGVEHDPSLATVDAIREGLRDAGCDVVLALGGGSAIDAAKAAAGLFPSPEPTAAFFDGKPIEGGGLPVLAAPSTFGTGSEATRVAVLTDPGRRLKKSIRHDDMLPRVALVDPVLGAGAPPGLTAACGMDALTQAIESYLSRHATDLTRAMSFSAIVLLVSGLPRAVADGHDMEGRENCANGSVMAGIALHNAGLGLVHGLAHPLGARYGLAHGEICGTLLPHVLRYNREAAGDHYKVLCGILGRDVAEFCDELARKVCLPDNLSHLAVPESDLPGIVGETLDSGSTKSNPRDVTAEDVRDILTKLTTP